MKPIEEIFKNEKIHIYQNDSGEFFLEHIATGTEIRLSARGEGLYFTTEDVVKPIIINGMIGWSITLR